MKQIFYSLLILFYSHTITTFSQYSEWINYTNGNDINAIEIDGDFVWIGTDGGLVKIDKTTGNSIYFNKTNSGLPSNFVSCIAIDEFGNKWIGTRAWGVGGGLSKFDGAEWTVYDETNSGLHSNYINCIAIDEVGNKWIGTPYGLVKFDGTDWSVFYSNDEITCLTMDNIGNLWIGAMNGLTKFDGKYWENYDVSNSDLPTNWINCITVDSENKKWIGTEGYGAVVYDDTNWIIYNASNSSLPYNDITCIAFDEFNTAWIGIAYDWNTQSDGGLVKYDGSVWSIYNMENSDLPGKGISNIAIDEYGIKWIGTFSQIGYSIPYGKGLVKYDEINWTKVNTSNSGLTSRFINCLAIDDKENKWIGCGIAWPLGTNKEGLVKFDGIDWTIYDEIKSLFTDSLYSEDYIKCITTDNLGNKWIGTSMGLVKFNGENWDIYNKSNSDLPTNMINCVTIDENNIWIGTPYGLVKFDGTDWTIYDKSNSGLSSNSVSCISIDESGILWIGTSPKYLSSSYEGGLVKFDGTGWTVFNKSNSGLPSNSVSCIVIDEFGNKWIGTQPEYNSSTNDHEGGGLAKFDGTNWTIYNESNSEIPDNWVQCLVIDLFNNKWIGTIGGLVKLDGTEWTIYDESNSGLPSSVVGCIEIDEFSNKWLGTSGGLAVFNEDGIVSMAEKKDELNRIPTNYVLQQNYPNPFNPSTTIKYSIPKQSNVTIKVFDLLGSEVTTLIDREQLRGNYEVEFDGSDLTSGIYFYRLKAGDYVETKKMILLK